MAYVIYVSVGEDEVCLTTVSTPVLNVTRSCQALRQNGVLMSTQSFLQVATCLREPCEGVALQHSRA